MRLQFNCVFCGESTMGVCGTPKIVWSGCCVGYTDVKRRLITSRYAHVKCFIKDKGKEISLMTEVTPERYDVLLEEVS